MKQIYDIWLLIGRETEGNSIKNYIFMHYNGNTQFIHKRSVIKFCREHNVLNVQISGDNITGKGMSITSLPRYVKQQGFGLQQVSGMSQDEVKHLAQPLINQYIQKKDAELQKKQENSTEAQKDKQNNYILNKLSVIENLINIALSMKDITNELASNGQFTRYLKQIDIDNAEGDSLTNLIQRQGVNGLANGLIDRLNRLNARITKYNLDRSLIDKIKELKSKCEQLRKLHSETKQIIKQNKDEKVRLEKDDLVTEIPIIDNNELEDIIEITPEHKEIPVIDSNELEDIIEITPEHTEITIESNKDKDVSIEYCIEQLIGDVQSKDKESETVMGYRNYSHYGLLALKIMSELRIYKNDNNKIGIRVGLCGLRSVKNSIIYPDGYALKATEENVEKLKEVKEQLINKLLTQYSAIDKLVEQEVQELGEINKFAKMIDNMSISDIVKYYGTLCVFKDDLLKIAYEDINKLKKTPQYAEVNYYKETHMIEYTAKYALEKIEKANKELNKTLIERQYKHIQEEKETKQIKEEQLNYNKELYEDLLSTLKDIFDDINDNIDIIQSEYTSDGIEYSDPFKNKAASTLKSVQSKINKYLNVSNTYYGNILPWRVNKFYFYSGETAFSRQSYEAMEPFENSIAKLINLFDELCIKDNKLAEKLSNIKEELEDLWQYNIDNSDDFSDTNGDFNSAYCEFIDGHAGEGQYAGIKGNIWHLIDVLGDCINRCKDEVTDEVHSSTTASPEDIREALKQFDDLEW